MVQFERLLYVNFCKRITNGDENMKETIIFTRMMHAFHRIRKVNIVPNTGISKMEFLALQIIDKSKQEKNVSGIYVSELAKGLGIASSQTSRMLKGLEERKLIARIVDGKDRRNTCVFLTEKGREICKETQTYMKSYMCRVLKSMGEEQIEELIKLCNELADAMEKEANK